MRLNWVRLADCMQGIWPGTRTRTTKVCFHGWLPGWLLRHLCYIMWTKGTQTRLQRRLCGPRLSWTDDSSPVNIILFVQFPLYVCDFKPGALLRRGECSTLYWTRAVGDDGVEGDHTARYQCIDADTKLAPGVSVKSVEFQNHSGLAFIYRQSVGLQRRSHDITVMTYRHLLQLLVAMQRQSVCSAGVYRSSGTPLPPWHW